MKKKYCSSIAMLMLVFLCSHYKMQACSMYKLTVDSTTLVGCNHDAWLTTIKIWFENAKQPNEYGAGFTGAREVHGKTAPQSGMNEAGLAFSRLVSYYPKRENPFPSRKKIGNEVDYLTTILHRCATIEEVKTHIEQYDHSVFLDDIFIYIDSTGDYLIVEPYQLIRGNDPHYVLANFCPSITSNEQARKLTRYRNGEDFLTANPAKASLDYCRALSDTMHVCRNRKGDGTLLTSIWNTREKVVNLFFYHSYDSTVQFSLTAELAKGDHLLSVPDLFPPNSEFEELISYKTPFNTPPLRVGLVVLSGLLTLLTLLYGIALMRKNKSGLSLKTSVLLSVLNVLLIAYLFVLATHRELFYFDAPYKHYGSHLISISSYIPFLLLFAFIPFCLFTIKTLKKENIKRGTKAILLSNKLLFLLLILSFAYWGLYTVWKV